MGRRRVAAGPPQLGPRHAGGGKSLDHGRIFSIVEAWSTTCAASAAVTTAASKPPA